MRIIQKKADGSAEIVFSDEEIKILNKNKKLILESNQMKHFVNNLVHVATQFNINLKKHMDQKSTANMEIKSK